MPSISSNVRGGLTFAGVNGQPRGLYETPKNNFMPRVGATYKLDDKTVLRGGYGMFYGFLGQRRGDVIHDRLQLDTQHGAVARQRADVHRDALESVPERHSAAGRRRAGHRDVPRPEHHVLRSENPSRRGCSAGRSASSASCRADGARGRLCRQPRRDIQTSRNLNATPTQYLSTSPTRDQATINYLGANVPNPFFGLMPATAGRVPSARRSRASGCCRPYPQFDAVNTTTNEGKSWYHALQAGLQKRFSAGYTLGVNYTYSRFEEATEFLNAADAGALG